MTSEDREQDETSQGWQSVRKKPVEVEAKGPFYDPTVVDTIEGDFEVDAEYVENRGGYYLLRGVEEEVYPCGYDIFHNTFHNTFHNPFHVTMSDREQSRERLDQ